MTCTEAPLRVLFDATRLTARRAATPTGIDRVDLAYATALATAVGVELQLVRFGVTGPALLTQRAGQQLLDEAAARWRTAEGGGEAEASFQRLRQWLESPPGISPQPAATPAPGRRWPTAPALQALLRYSGGALRRRRREAPTIYLNTSHGHLFRPAAANWLRRNVLRSAFFVHDLIPIEYPQFNRPREPQRHARRLATVAAHASQVLVNSETTRAALCRYLRQHGLRLPPVSVVPLGVEAPFTGPSAALRPGLPYFVILSTIEPRKNHQLLLRLWPQLVESLGAAAPRLVVIGRRGWENQEVFDRLDRAATLGLPLIECAGLSDSALAAVLRGARALLSPSLAEGFGLPVAEALATGTPVIASDIAAHREISGDHAELLDPSDDRAWLQALLDYATADSPRRRRQVQNLASYHPPSWARHFATAIGLLRQAAAAPTPSSLPDPIRHDA